MSDGSGEAIGARALRYGYIGVDRDNIIEIVESYVVPLQAEVERLRRAIEQHRRDIHSLGRPLDGKYGGYDVKLWSVLSEHDAGGCICMTAADLGFSGWGDGVNPNLIANEHPACPIHRPAGGQPIEQKEVECDG
jgi:hypothetical protein